MIESPDYDVRYSEMEDSAHLERWFTYPGMLAAFPPSDDQEKELMINFWKSFFRFRCSLTATFQGVPCAVGTLFLMPYRKVSHYSLFYMVVDPDYQRKGVGSSLLKNLKHLGKNQFRLEQLQCEIFCEDRGIEKLLAGQDFSLLMKQDGFVKEKGVYSPRYIYKAYL